MAQNITLLGASYSDVPSVELPKTGGGTAQFDDTTIASNAAGASDITSGKLAFVNGLLITGTASGGGGGLVYETGTWTPAEDISRYDISFTNTHSVAPFYYMISNAENEYSSETNSSFGTIYFNYHQLFGQKWYVSSTSMRYGQVIVFYRGSSGTSVTNSVSNLTLPYTDTSVSSNAPRFWATESKIRAQASSTSYWRAGNTYKWVAVWAPTS